jgi:hypothetical protein
VDETARLSEVERHLIETPERNIDAATGSSADERPSQQRHIGCLAAFLLAIVGAAAGAFGGGWIGLSFSPPAPSNCDCIGPMGPPGQVVLGGVVGLFVGAIALPWLGALLLSGLGLQRRGAEEDSPCPTLPV